jgi:hypothetical protein
MHNLAKKATKSTENVFKNGEISDLLLFLPRQANRVPDGVVLAPKSRESV